MKFRLGTRKSALALRQASIVHDALKRGGCPTELISIESEGDEQSSIPLYQIQSDSPGLFTKRIEQALLEKKIDLAVHSFKDLPTQQPEGLEVAAVTAREEVSDCLLLLESVFDPAQYLGIPEKAKLGTSSLRRQAQFNAVRPDLDLIPIRGNVLTRLEALKEGKVEALVLAEAGVNRLNLDLEGIKRQTLPIDKFVPAPAQGALAIEVRTDCPPELRKAILCLNDEVSSVCTFIERTIMKDLEGGCTLPLGVYCQKLHSEFKVQAFLGEKKERVWSCFHRFDFQSASQQTLVTEVVRFFRSKTKCQSQEK